jgi:hypothetical protein
VCFAQSTAERLDAETVSNIVNFTLAGVVDELLGCVQQQATHPFPRALLSRCVARRLQQRAQMSSRNPLFFPIRAPVI